MKYKEIFDKLKFNNLTEVQQKISNLKNNKNILIVSSCGSGKTEASYFKMLEYNKKIIFIEPMKTLANSISDRLEFYNKRLGIGAVTIQHSSSQEDRFLQNKYSVTTIDQVLAGYLAMGKQAYIKGKNVLMSNVIFDEVQLFDTDTMLLTTINMLDEIYKLGNKFIIMTATMPQFLIDFLGERYDMEIIITEKVREDRNVKLFYEEELNYDKVINYKDKQIIICNTIKQLKEIHNNLPNSRVITLHSTFLNSDRLKLEEQVDKYFGKHSEQNDKILLTTQIVEVGMDISCNRLCTTACKIDNLVQRDGRCCRWGGKGQVIVFKNDDNIYEKELVENTILHIENNQGINFNWMIQKQWINEILNQYYKDKINDKSLRKNKQNFKGCNRSKLIRDIQNVNIIVVNKENITKQDFNRESVSIHINKLKLLLTNNDLYILNKNRIEKTEYYKIEMGDTIVIRGNGCIYDDLGFRYEENCFIEIPKCRDFPIIDKSINNQFKDYIEETWIHHAETVRDLMAYRLNQEQFNEYIINNMKKISFYGGLHDLGKLDIEWSKKYKSAIPLAHFPFIKGNIGERRTHELISGEILKSIIDDKIIYNMIIQHHKRLYNDEDIEYKVTNWKLHKDTYKILNTYGLDKEIELQGNARILKRKSIITPADKEWTTLLYLTGTFMDCEIQAISEYIDNYKQVS